MKHIFYVLLAALALLLVSSCKKNQDTDTALQTVEGRWKYIGQAAPTIVWASDTSSSFLSLNNNHYEEFYQGAVVKSGTYELLTVTRISTDQQAPGILFKEENRTYTISFRHDTLVLDFNERTPCGMTLFLERYDDTAR